MIFTTDKESLLNKLRTVEKITVQRGIQPVLSNILFETEKNTLKLTATDLDISIITNTAASVKEEGKITLPAKKIFEIVSKLPDKPVNFELNKETNTVTIKCGTSKFDIIGISAEEFPRIVEDEKVFSDKEAINIETSTFTKSIKNTVYSAANYESRNIISGVFCSIKEDSLEMAATDGNRLTKYSEKIQNKNDQNAKVVIPSKTLNEFLRISSLINEEKTSIIITGSKIIFKGKSFILISKLLEGEYPPYKQLIPKSTGGTATVKREELNNALEIASCMVNERTSIMKFIFTEGKLILKAETPDAGTSEDVIAAEYKGEDLTIAFNYKYVSDFIKTTDSEKTQIGLNGSLSATIFKPDSNNEKEDYLYLIMPIKI